MINRLLSEVKINWYEAAVTGSGGIKGTECKSRARAGNRLSNAIFESTR